MKKIFRKNPVSNYIELEKLVDQEVTVIFNNNKIRFSVQESLQKWHGDEYKIKVYGKRNKKVNYGASIKFLRSDIESINKNNINLTYISQKNWGFEPEFNKELIDELINKNIHIDIANSQMFLPIYFGGILKFNKKDNFYYIQSYDLKIQIRFTLESIEKVDQNTSTITLNI